MGKQDIIKQKMLKSKTEYLCKKGKVKWYYKLS
nr:MAG TPA: hypothetical protein [Caudoviricetes sp.]